MTNDSKMEKKCFIWTRVSTKYQEDNGGSLDNKKYKCETYAREHGFTIMNYFGGKHESAKTPGCNCKEAIISIAKITIPKEMKKLMVRLYHVGG